MEEILKSDRVVIALLLIVHQTILYASRYLNADYNVTIAFWTTFQVIYARLCCEERNVCSLILNQNQNHAAAMS